MYTFLIPDLFPDDEVSLNKKQLFLGPALGTIWNAGVQGKCR